MNTGYLTTIRRQKVQTLKEAFDETTENKSHVAVTRMDKVGLYKNYHTK